MPNVRRREMSLTRISLWAMGIGGTIVYAGLGLVALRFGLQPRWLYVLGAVVCFARVLLIWYDLWRTLRLFESRNMSSSANLGAEGLRAHHSQDVRTHVHTSDAEGRIVFRNLRRIQFAQHTFYTAFVLGCLFVWGWLYLLVRRPDHPNWIDVVAIGLLTACFLIAVGVLAYLITRRCPNCQTAFSWNWMRSDVLQREHAGRCANCGIRINVYNLQYPFS